MSEHLDFKVVKKKCHQSTSPVLCLKEIPCCFTIFKRLLVVKDYTLTRGNSLQEIEMKMGNGSETDASMRFDRSDNRCDVSHCLQHHFRGWTSEAKFNSLILHAHSKIFAYQWLI